MSNDYRSQDAPSGVTVKFDPGLEFASNIQVQKRLEDPNTEGESLRKQIQEKTEEMILSLRKDWDALKAHRVMSPVMVKVNDDLPDVVICVTYNHMDKTVKVVAVTGWVRQSQATVDLENEAVGSVVFKPSNTVYAPDAASKKPSKKMAVPPPAAAPSNAPRLPGGALKA